MDHLVLRHPSYMRGFTYPFSLSEGFNDKKKQSRPTVPLRDMWYWSFLLFCSKLGLDGRPSRNASFHSGTDYYSLLQWISSLFLRKTLVLFCTGTSNYSSRSRNAGKKSHLSADISRDTSRTTIRESSRRSFPLSIVVKCWLWGNVVDTGPDPAFQVNSVGYSFDYQKLKKYSWNFFFFFFWN